jgi:hypothetical protein
MNTFTRPANWDDLRAIAQFLLDAGVDYALVGGYALAAHGFARFTEDIDIVVDPSAQNSRRWIVALARLPDGAARALIDESDVFADDQRHAIRINDEFTIDVMPSVAGNTWQELTPYIEQIDLDGVPLKVLSLEGLLRTKLGARPKDMMDAQVLRAAIAGLKSADSD